MRIIKLVVRKVLYEVRKIFLRIYFTFFDAAVECNICGWKDFRFKSDGWHPHTICPNCNSQVRQRLFIGILENLEEFGINTIIKDKTVLHFAPDKELVSLLKSHSKDYKTADLLTEGYSYSDIDFNIDMSDMKGIMNAAYDCIIAFDVLEHIPNHLDAIRECNRILKKDGYCVFTVPQKDNLAETIEDLTITDPKEREMLFGQDDHWRIYGNDFEQMIADQGFSVYVLDEKSLDKKIVERNVLFPPIMSKHPLATNYRKIYIGKKK